MSDAFELEICQGKYRYRYEAGRQEVWRNGEPWPVMNGRLIGDKFVFSLAVELNEALKEQNASKALIDVLRAENAKLHARIGQMENVESALSTLLNDLEERAKWNFEETQRIVACGNGVYMRAKAALERNRNEQE